MTTSDKRPGGRAGRHVSRAKVLVVVTILGAAAFGLYIGYLAYTNDSFPAQQRPFADYANVTSSTFNGTEFALWVKWLNASYLPLYAQVTSDTTDAANTPVCDIGLSAIAAGQTIFMPFGISQPSTSLQNVDLSIAVKSSTNSTEFTIVYSIASIPASSGLIMPSDVSCEQPAGVE